MENDACGSMHELHILASAFVYISEQQNNYAGRIMTDQIIFIFFFADLDATLESSTRRLQHSQVCQPLFSSEDDNYSNLLPAH